MSADEETNVRVYSQVSPGVVNITRTTVEYSWFWAPVAREGSGSGCVLDKEGNILTNYHVISRQTGWKFRSPIRRDITLK